MTTIYFDMDGTIANLYGVEGWLESLRAGAVEPYAAAAPLLRMATLARILNRLQRNGFEIGIISWTAKGATEEYNKRVAATKVKWLERHLHSVRFNEIHIVDYGTPKSSVVKNPYGILFDDEEQNRKEWLGTAYDVNNIINVLKAIA